MDSLVNEIEKDNSCESKAYGTTGGYEMTSKDPHGKRTGDWNSSAAMIKNINSHESEEGESSLICMTGSYEICGDSHISRNDSPLKEKIANFKKASEGRLMASLPGNIGSFVPGKIQCSKSIAGGYNLDKPAQRRLVKYEFLFPSEKDKKEKKNKVTNLVSPGIKTRNGKSSLLTSAAEDRVDNQLVITGGDEDAPPIGCICWPLVQLVYRIRFRLFGNDDQDSDIPP